MSTCAKKGVRLPGTDEIIAAMGVAAQRPQGETEASQAPDFQSRANHVKNLRLLKLRQEVARLSAEVDASVEHRPIPPPSYGGQLVRYPSCHFCGKRDADVEPLLLGMLDTCPACLRKAVLWGLSFSASWERETKK